MGRYRVQIPRIETDAKLGSADGVGAAVPARAPAGPEDPVNAARFGASSPSIFPAPEDDPDDGEKPAPGPELPPAAGMKLAMGLAPA